MKTLPLALSLLGLIASSTLFASEQLPVHVGGRVLDVNHSDQRYYEYSWPSVYFETAFIGSDLTLKFDDNQNIFNLFVDNKEPIVISKPGTSDFVVEGLTQGKHQIRLEKITETQWAGGKFLGFFSSGKALAVKPRARQIEFIGDSYTVGYGNISSTTECSTEDVYNTTHSQRAFGPLVAKQFNADYQINASSGFGVVRNYNGINPDKSLISIYPFSLQHTHYVYAGKWNPQMIVVGLGTNDFSTPLNEGERWSSREELQQDYVFKYVEFVKYLRAKHPKAHVLLMASDLHNGEISAQLDRVIARLKEERVTRVDHLIFSGLEYKGCHGHPSIADDETLAIRLADYIKKQKIW